MNNRSKCFSLAGLAALGTLLLTVNPAHTADHRDGPTVSEDPAADILDVYVFRNQNNGNTVLAMTVAPFLVAGPPQAPFSPTCLYQFKIDNTGDAKEDLVIQATFSRTPTSPFGTLPNPAPAQQFTLRGPSQPEQIGLVTRLLDGRRNRVFSGPVNQTVVTGPDGIRAFAGLRDDPFFIDFIFANGILGGRLIGRNPGFDTFAGLNCLALVVEVPPALLRGPAGDNIKVWGSTSRGTRISQTLPPLRGPHPTGDEEYFIGTQPVGSFVQIESMGLPIVNTVFIPFPLKEAFNRTAPSDMRARFKTAASNRITQILTNISGLLPKGTTPSGQADATTNIVFPDVIPFNVTSNAGFLNGRRPDDDVVTTLLRVLTNNPAVTDGVESNDKAFLGDFPFFAAPHSASEAVPSRD